MCVLWVPLLFFLFCRALTSLGKQQPLARTTSMERHFWRKGDMGRCVCDGVGVGGKVMEMECDGRGVVEE